MSTNEPAEHGDHPSASHTVTPDEVIAIALERFAESGYRGAKLEQIAKDSGMSKRMIHYHFGDKLGLYHRALVVAVDRLHMPKDELQIDTAVPVEAVRKLIDGMFNAFVNNPQALRLVQWDNIAPPKGCENRTSLYDESEFVLHLDRILLLGQDVGAFRPGISAQDLYALITSVLYHREANRSMFRTQFGVDLADEANVDGMRHMLVDTVLAFLTAHIPHDGTSGYLTRQTSEESQQGSIYEDSSGSAGLFEAYDLFE